ncbi:type II toxin-antitoxin system PemK/MazF family toxin [Chitinophaga sp. GbtcB8]|uniref:type II toxin-antitoxin system PemK/MazF family toxin n=1 Tax=Chitinophaga sp. GbtcB8 TaxID=2824753 RepID=UPI001C2FF12A|nr:type II toxin-antitoxin system PemK/MazF family toxin [Chitinophaga sp. GbtcB8]
MAVNQRDVFLLPHPYGSNYGEPHPHIVLSILEANQHENTFIAVMVTSSEITRDDFSFTLLDEMFEKPLAKKNSHARMHLLTLSFGEDIDRPKINTMKAAPFRALMKSIGDLIFNFQFLPQ